VETDNTKVDAVVSADDLSVAPGVGRDGKASYSRRNPVLNSRRDNIVFS